MNRILSIVGIIGRDIFAYRSALVMWVLIDLVTPFSLLAVWLGVYRHQAMVGPLDASQMVAYYLGVLFVTSMITVHQEWDIYDDIRIGRLRMNLTKPLPFWLHHLVAPLVWRAYTAALTVPIAVGGFYFVASQNGIQLPSPLSGAFFLALIVGLALWMSLSHLLGYLTFFIERPHSLFHLVFILRWLLSGSIIPLALFPTAVNHALRYTPFPYFFGFPIESFTVPMTSGTYWGGIAIALAWTLLFSGLAVLAWHQGLRRYDAPEGQAEA